MPRTVLVADENDLARRKIVQFLQAHGYQVYEAETGDAALDMIDSMRFDAAIIDYYMHGVFNGLDLLARQSHAAPASRRILITAFVNAHVKQMADAVGASCLPKRFSLDDLLRNLEGVVPPPPNTRARTVKPPAG